MTGEDLVRRRAVRWLSPAELLRTGAQVALAGVFGKFADKREMQQGPAFEQEPFVHGGADDFWFDYVSDIGDGFDATYSVASLLAGDLAGLQPDGADLPRGDVLILGGDEVYPTADATAYEQRTTRVLEAAFPPREGTRPVMYAVPGNHDWYDGLTAFLRIFGQGKDIGGWLTQQRRSYFALRLPRRWWLLAVDIQLDTYIDWPQLEYFRRVAEDIEDDASIVLCTAVPSWYRAGEDGTSLDRLAYFLKHTLAGKSSRVRVVLTGDAHHYARYTRADEDWPVLITAGHGGAYTSATHRLPERLSVTARLADPTADKTSTDTYERVPVTWPSQEDSRRAARGVLWRLTLRNPGLVLLFATLYGLLVGSIVFEAWLWTIVLLSIIVAGSVAFAQPRSGRVRSKIGYGLGLAGLELVPTVTAVWAFAVVVPNWAWYAQAFAALGAVVVGGVLAAELLALWLLMVSRWRVNENELFAAQGLEHHKGFLRIRIDTDGVLTVFPVGLRRSVRRWQRASSSDGPRLVPADPHELRYQLIEPPVAVRQAPPGAPDGSAYATRDQVPLLGRDWTG